MHEVRHEMHVYHSNSTDFKWDALSTLEATIAAWRDTPVPEPIAAEKGKDYRFEEEITQLKQEFATVKRVAEELAWKGDFATTPCIFYMADEHGFFYGFAFKRNDDKGSFTIAPFEMPWLEGEE